jgi:hypothetical protein
MEIRPTGMKIPIGRSPSLGQTGALELTVLVANTKNGKAQHVVCIQQLQRQPRKFHVSPDILSSNASHVKHMFECVILHAWHVFH